jgi:hypothetical protein
MNQLPGNKQHKVVAIPVGYKKKFPALIDHKEVSVPLAVCISGIKNKVTASFHLLHKTAPCRVSSLKNLL